jgi:hypothetical protein
MSGDGQPVFDQRGWQVNKVYNIAGDLHEGASPAELVASLRQLRDLIGELPGLAPAQRAEIGGDVTEAIEAAAEPQVDGDRVVGALTRVRDRLRILGLAAGEGLTLTKSVADIIAWVQGHL